MKLIINADDYGLSPLFNKGILELAGGRVISSISVMIKQPHLEPDDLKSLPHISIGLHLELVENDSEEEIEDQILRFVRLFSQLPSHLDGHYHNHLAEKNIPKIIDLAKKFKLPVRSYREKDRKLLLGSAIKTPSEFISWHPNRIEKLENKLSESVFGSREMVCHPGYFDDKSSARYNIEREKELEYLRSDRFKNILKKYQLINYHEL